MSSGACPAIEQLKAYVLGSSTEFDKASVQNHLTHCKKCQSVVNNFSFPTLTRPLQKSGSSSGSGSTGKTTDKIQESFDFLQPAVEADEIGRLGNYRVLRILGRGGMGIVFLAEDLQLHRPVALKVMRPELKGDVDGWRRFLREARTMASIKHDNLVTIFAAGQEEQVVYFAMELLEGESLEAWMKRNPNADIAAVLRIFRELCEGLSALHGKGLIHRDMKPANIWIESPKGRVKILDLGLARTTEPEESPLTVTGMILGTPAFMSPEQARGDEVDHRTDLFSLGCILYNLATGRRPFLGSTSTAVLMALAAEKPPIVSTINPTVPEPLSDLIMQLLERRPQQRPASAEAILLQLDRIEQNLKLPPGVTQPLRSAPKNKRDTIVPTGDDRTTDRKQDFETQTMRAERPSRFGPILAIALTVFVFLAGLTYFLVKNSLANNSPGPLVQKKEKDKNDGNKQLPPDVPEEDPMPIKPVKPPEKKPPVVVPAGPPVYLTDLRHVEAEHWPHLRDDKKDDKKKKKDDKKEEKKDFDGSVRFQGKPYPKGIFMHPPGGGNEGQPASLTYALGKSFRTFSGRVALNDGPPESMLPITFEVYGDSRLLWRSKAVQTQNDTQAFSVPVEKVDRLKITAFVNGEPMAAHAVWLDPVLMK